jgi:hypothetical protein
MSLPVAAIASLLEAGLERASAALVEFLSVECFSLTGGLGSFDAKTDEARPHHVERPKPPLASMFETVGVPAIPGAWRMPQQKVGSRASGRLRN